MFVVFTEQIGVGIARGLNSDTLVSGNRYTGNNHISVRGGVREKKRSVIKKQRGR